MTLRRFYPVLTGLLGTYAFFIALCSYNLADNDLWARLAQGASLWHRGHLIRDDAFAFTPMHAVYIDPEWLTGLFFFTLLKYFGPSSLLVLKAVLAITTVGVAMAAARLRGAKTPYIFLLALPCAATLMPGTMSVLRAHTLTFLFLACCIYGLEAVVAGRRCFEWFLVALFWLWANSHGGFVLGFLFTVFYLVFHFREPRIRKKLFLVMGLGFLVTLANPYSIGLWQFIGRHARDIYPFNYDWDPTPFFQKDILMGFRVLLLLTVLVLISRPWTSITQPEALGLFLMAFTAFMGLKHYRLAPVFGICALVYLGTHLELWVGQFRRLASWARNQEKLMVFLLLLYVIVAAIVSRFFFPSIWLQVLAPIERFPVREVDILSRAGSEGRIIVPLEWGSYVSWRLYPRMQVSYDGRNEMAFKKEAAILEGSFYSVYGMHWDRLLKDYNVDYVLVNLESSTLMPQDLYAKGFGVVWIGHQSVLLARLPLLAKLKEVAKHLPPETIEPLDAKIPESWW